MSDMTEMDIRLLKSKIESQAGEIAALQSLIARSESENKRLLESNGTMRNILGALKSNLLHGGYKADSNEILLIIGALNPMPQKS